VGGRACVAQAGGGRARRWLGGCRGGVPGERRERCRAPRAQAPWRGLTRSWSGRIRSRGPARPGTGHRPGAGRRTPATAAGPVRETGGGRVGSPRGWSMDRGRIGDAGEDPHRGPTVQAEQRKHLVDSRQQHRPGGDETYVRCTVSAARCVEPPGGGDGAASGSACAALSRATASAAARRVRCFMVFPHR